MAESLNYFEDLKGISVTCPHEDALVPDGVKLFYRVLKSDSASSQCYLPTPIKEGKPIPKGFDDCIGRSVSVYDDLEGMINGFFKLPSNKGKKKYVGILKLKEVDGRIKQTFDHKNHHSWWRSENFDITTVIIHEFVL